MFRTLAILALTGAALLPGVAHAQVTVQCAIKSYDTGVIMTANSDPDQALLNEDGAVCSEAIASGNWFGVDKFGSWVDQGYVRACTAKVDAVQSVSVFAIYRDTSSAMDAVTICGNMQKLGATLDIPQTP